MRQPALASCCTTDPDFKQVFSIRFVRNNQRRLWKREYCCPRSGFEVLYDETFVADLLEDSENTCMTIVSRCPKEHWLS